MNLNNRFGILQEEREELTSPRWAAEDEPLDNAVVAISELKEQLTSVWDGLNIVHRALESRVDQMEVRCQELVRRDNTIASRVEDCVSNAGQLERILGNIWQAIRRLERAKVDSNVRIAEVATDLQHSIQRVQVIQYTVDRVVSLVRPNDEDIASGDTTASIVNDTSTHSSRQAGR